MIEGERDILLHESAEKEKQMKQQVIWSSFYSLTSHHHFYLKLTLF